VQPDSNKEEKREKLIKAFKDTLERFDSSGSGKKLEAHFFLWIKL
ncbi:unnamed protein product, partial [Larinioides sclopetarius]